MKIKKERLKQIIKDELEEAVGNWFHDEDGEFSDERGARSKTRHDIGQFEYPSNKTKKPCGREDRSTTCKRQRRKEGKILPPKNEELEEELDNQDAKYLKAIIGQEIRRAIADATKNNGCSFSDLVRAMTIWKKAETAKATSPK